MHDDTPAILDRHAIRRRAGVPTVSVLAGQIGAGQSLWARWLAGAGQRVVFARQGSFPYPEWIRSIADRFDLRAAGVRRLAQRSGRDPDRFLAEWNSRTPADCERFFNTLAPDDDDNLLRKVTSPAFGRSDDGGVAALSDLGEAVALQLTQLAPSTSWPGLLFVAVAAGDIAAAGRLAVNWATQVPASAVAIAVPAEAWDDYVATAPESRTKAVLREGLCLLPGIDRARVKQTLLDAGASASAAAAVAACGADVALVESAVAAIRATSAPPATREENDGARSAAERFLFMFLQSLPETAGCFELNGTLDFRFGPRQAEVDLLCRSPRIAIEVDGYFHFLAPAAYRRDRSKDWELQRRGYIVLRFLAEDVIPELETIRDRILNTLISHPDGE